MEQLQENLQNQFTTPEQSGRLMEVGVPANSADCYYDTWGQIQWRKHADLNKDFFEKYPQYVPAWTSGRLIELYVKYVSEISLNIYEEDNLCEYFVGQFEDEGSVDFSKFTA